jgi:polyisoprenoid-binding protein YceI
MRKVAGVAVVVLLLGAASCCGPACRRRPPAAPAVPAVPADPAPAPAAPAAPAQPGVVPAGATAPAPAASTSRAAPGAAVAVTPQNTTIEFVGSAGPKTQPGRFTQFGGSLAWAGDPSTDRLAVEIDMNSVTTNFALLTRHLKGEDFFDVARYPKATFVSTAIRPAQTPGATHTITGDLTLHGVTRTISVPATITPSAEGVSLSSRFVIRQSDHGMDRAVKKCNDEVPVTITIRAARP